jgi:hypothetical protein
VKPIATLERLEKTFNWERDEEAVRQLRDTVTDYEYCLKKQLKPLNGHGFWTKKNKT